MKLKLGNLTKTVNDLNAINQALGGKDKGLEEAVETLNQVNELNETLKTKEGRTTLAVSLLGKFLKRN